MQKQINKYIEEVLKEFLNYGIHPHGEGLPNPIGMWQEEQQRLLTYLYYSPPDLDWLEIGSYCGGTTLLMCLSRKNLNRTNQIIACDSNFNEFFFHNIFTRGKFDDVEPMWCKSDELGEVLQGSEFCNIKFGFVLIDGFHSFKQVCTDFEVVKPRLKKGSIICFHDCGPQLEIEKFRKDFPQELVKNPSLLQDLLNDESENFYIDEVISWLLYNYPEFSFYNIEVGRDCYHPHETQLMEWIRGRTSPKNALFAIKKEK